MAESPGEFAVLLRELRVRARLTQQELAESAGISLRRVNGLERGGTATPQRETVRALADALSLVGPERVRFETAARGRPLVDVPVAAAAAAMRSLPRDVTSFTGRQRELEQLAKSAAAAGGVISIHAIGGMAGVGKTAFAVHAAHQLADRFSGGHVFLPLHGHTPGQRPVDPADALASLLLAVGVPPAQVPPGLEARAVLWRDRAAGQPLLLVLDDAAGSEQIRPLLPGTGGSLVLVTSRRHLSALDDITSVSLDTFPPADAAELLVRLARRPGLAPEDPGVREIARLCGYLPLAVGMMGRQLHHHPSWNTAGLAAELSSARGRLELLETEGLSVAAAFDLSYADLTADQQRLFRRLGLHPGVAVDAYAAAALGGVSLPAARRGLIALYDQYLLTEPGQGRYRLHDLIREHSRALAERLDPGEDRDAATARLLDYYEHAVAAADALIIRRARPGAPPGGPAPAALPALAGNEQALAWVRAERANLLASLDYAADAGQPARVVGLTAGLNGLLTIDGPWADAVARHAAAVAAARQLGDRLGEANALNDLGEAHRLADDNHAAARVQRESLAIYRELGDRLGQANALYCLGAVSQVTGEFRLGVQVLSEAHGIYRELGDQRSQANALLYLGILNGLLEDYAAEAQALTEALDAFRALGDRLGQANVLMFLGDLRGKGGDNPAAAETLEEALGLYRDLGRVQGVANSLWYLAKVLLKTADYPAAGRNLDEALGIYRTIGDRRGQANAALSLGVMRRMTGDSSGAAGALAEALGRYRDIGDREGEADALNHQGILHRLGDEHVLARACHQRALELSREIAVSAHEASALAGLGRCALAAGDPRSGEARLRQALEIFQRIGAGEAAEVRAELAALAGS